MALCPTCGQKLPHRDFRINTEHGLLAAMREPSNDGRPREVYIAQDHRSWYLTYGGGPVDPVVVNSLAGKGMIRRVYSNTDGAYGLGRTIDIDLTLEKRKRTGDRKVLVYAGDSA